MAFSAIDVDGGGEISYQEFIEWWNENGDFQLDEEVLRQRSHLSAVFRVAAPLSAVFR